MQAALLPLSPRSPSQLDPADDANLVQARWEFDRARDRGSEGDLAAWARRWGPGFVEGENPRSEVEALEEQLSQVEAERDAPVDTSAVAAELDDARECIDTAIELLAAPITASEATDHLKDALTFIGKAHQELGAL